MNKFVRSLVLFLLAFGITKAFCVIPDASYILEQTVQKSPVKNFKPIKLKALNFNNLKLDNSGLNADNKPINLYSLDILINSKSKKALEDYLDQAFVDKNIVSLNFFGNEPVYVIGAQAKNQTSPQIWIDKSNWLIVKEIGKKHEIIFDKWQALKSAGTKFPQKISIKVGTKTTNYDIAED